jgi:hypothetical protein
MLRTTIVVNVRREIVNTLATVAAPAAGKPGQRKSPEKQLFGAFLLCG